MTIRSSVAALAAAALLTGVGGAAYANTIARQGSWAGAAHGAATPASRHAKVPSLVGAGHIHSFIAPNDDISFRFDARGFFTDATGTFSLVHVVRATGQVARQSGYVDCLTVSGNVATVTVIVTSSNVPEPPPNTPDLHPGKLRLAFSVEDNGGHGRDLLGFSWGIVDNRAQPRCMAIAPFAPVTSGHFRVRSAPLTAPPSWIPPGAGQSAARRADTDPVS
jgi:hypothetical protein